MIFDEFTEYSASLQDSKKYGYQFYCMLTQERQAIITKLFFKISAFHV